MTDVVNRAYLPQDYNTLNNGVAMWCVCRENDVKKKIGHSVPPTSQLRSLL